MKQLSMKQGKGVTLQDLFDEFNRFNKIKNLSPKTIEYYEEKFRYFCEFIDKDTQCENISENTFYDYIAFLRENKQIKDATLKSYLTAVRAILYYGIKKGYIKQFTVQIPKMDKTIKETYTDNEIITLLQKPNVKTCSFSEFRNWVIVNFIMATGVRVGTLIHIKIEDVDFGNAMIKLSKLKGRRQYYIPMSKSLIMILQEYLLFRKGEPEQYLFCSIYGKMMTENSVESAIYRYNKSRGIFKTSVHVYRHTFAKNWILNGGDIFRLQKLLGHRSLDMVREYVNMFGDDLKKDFDEFNPLNKYVECNQGDLIQMKK